MGEGTAALLAFCCCLFPPLILQSVGLFTPKWVSNDTCSSIGLVYSCCSGDDNETCAISNGGDELDQRALGLHATAFSIMFLAVFGSCCGGCCKNEDEDTGWCGALGCCCVVLLPVAGLFSFIGCMLLVLSYEAPQLGYSFYLCFTAGWFVAIIITVVLCWLACRMNKHKDDDGESGSIYAAENAGAVQSYSGSGGVAQYGGGGQAVIGRHAVIEQRAVVHEPETGGVFMSMRRINITILVGTLTHGDD